MLKVGGAFALLEIAARQICSPLLKPSIHYCLGGGRRGKQKAYLSSFPPGGSLTCRR